MKIQCACGAKFAFDITPDMINRPMQFICPTCGLDASDFVNNLVRQELASAAGAPAESPAQSAPAAAPAPAAPMLQARLSSPVAAPAQAAAPAPAPKRMRVELHGPGPVAPPEGTDVSHLCSKHPEHEVTEKCYVCSKPICPKCMELFGYVCSPLCKAKADSRGIQVPEYAGQKSVIEARLWRKVGRITYATCGVAAAVLGFWFWYAWFGSQPSASFSVRFPEIAFSGQSSFLGKNQIVFIHGGDLAMHDMKEKKQLWSRKLIDHSKMEADAKKAIKRMEDMVAHSEASIHDSTFRIPPLETMTKRLERSAESDLHLRVQGDNIWVITPEKLTRYDKDTGNAVKEIPLPKSYGRLIPRGEELLQLETDFAADKQTLTHINLNSCELRTEEIAMSARGTNAAATAAAGAKSGPGANVAGTRGSDRPGMPTPSDKDSDTPMDPKKVAEQAQHMSLPERIALPITIANARNQERALKEARDPSDPKNPRKKAEPEERFSLVLTKDGYLQLSVKLIEAHFIERAAMKSAPSKSVLDGNLTVAKTGELANEMLNEAQRERGGAVEREDQSRYQLTFKRPVDASPWVGEVIGRPQLFPLTTVDVVAGYKMITVLDKTHKKLWQSTLNYNVQGGFGGFDEEMEERHGEGPCVERKGVLYVADQGVLTAFDLATGNVRWRVPTVGVSGMFFDDKDMMYVNTTTASPDTIKFSNQIDITAKNAPVVMRVDAKTGKALWAAQPGGPVSYVSGKFVYTLQSYRPMEDDDHPFEQKTGFETPPYVHIKRINPKNGRQMWDYFEQRAPFDVQFDQNTVRLVFKKEVEVLKYLAF